MTQDWPAAHVAVAVVGPDGIVASRGDRTRPFDLASVTKLLTAFACLVAVEEGTLALDEPAGPPGATVRHLLAHAAGLGFDGGVVAGPGQRRTYSNAGFEALADHLTRAAGMPGDRYVHEAVVEALGLRSTEVVGRSLAAGARSTVDDLSRFAAELLAPTLIARSTLAEATTVQFPGLAGILPGFGRLDPNDWGLGFECRDHKVPHWTGPRCSPATYGHFGAAGTFLWVDPAAGTALVTLTDEPFGEWSRQAWPELSDEVLAGVGWEGPRRLPASDQYSMTTAPLRRSR